MEKLLKRTASNDAIPEKMFIIDIIRKKKIVILLVCIFSKYLGFDSYAVLNRYFATLTEHRAVCGVTNK